MSENTTITATRPDPSLIVQVARRFEALYGDHGPHVLRLVNDMADLIEATPNSPVADVLGSGS